MVLILCGLFFLACSWWDLHRGETALFGWLLGWFGWADISRDDWPLLFWLIVGAQTAFGLIAIGLGLAHW